MANSHLVDPELLPMLASFPPLQLSNEALPQLRASVRAALEGSATDDHPSVRVESVEFPGTGGAPSVAALVYRPGRDHSTAGILLHIHGGGYVTGSAKMAEAENRQICAELGCAVVSIDYRLAPETPHPGPLEDCYQVLQAVYSGSAFITGDRSRIAVSGDSAGGGLAAALALLARDRGELKIALQHLIYPMLDDRTCVRSNQSPFLGEFVWTAEHNRFGWASLLQVPPGSENVSQCAAAARAADLSGLPRRSLPSAHSIFFSTKIWPMPAAWRARASLSSCMFIQARITASGGRGAQTLRKWRRGTASTHCVACWRRRSI
jgi:acetyl esterase/lipase